MKFASKCRVYKLLVRDFMRNKISYCSWKSSGIEWNSVNKIPLKGVCLRGYLIG